MKNADHWFGVGSPAVGYSSVWKLKARKGAGNIYIGARSVFSDVKISLHDFGGHCQLGLTQEEAARRGIERTHRHWDIWKVAPDRNGFTIAIVLVFPVKSLRPELFKEGTATKPIDWIPPDQTKDAIEVACCFSDKGIESGDWPGRIVPGTVPTLGLEYSNGRSFWLVAYPRNFDPDFRKGLKKIKADQAKRLAPRSNAGELLRSYLLSAYADGTRFVCELAAPELLGHEPSQAG